ncbi:MAG: hypothetical protein Q9160_000215 [Pyrenula sp. 1 TL-2023]
MPLTRDTTLILGPPPSQILFSDCEHLTPAMFAPRTLKPTNAFLSSMPSSLSQRLYRGRCRHCDFTRTTRRTSRKQASLRSQIEGLDQQIHELEQEEATTESIRSSVQGISDPGVEGHCGEGSFGSALFGKLEELKWRQERLRLGTEEWVMDVWKRFEEKWGARDCRHLMYG